MTSPDEKSKITGGRSRLVAAWLIMGMLLVSFYFDIKLGDAWNTPGPLWGLAGMSLAALLSIPIAQTVVSKFADMVVQAQTNKEKNP